MEQQKKSIYLVLSTNETWPEILLRKRAEMQFLNRKKGDCYVHIGISFDKKLNNMVAFTRKHIHNIFDAGLAVENINEGIFNKKQKVGKLTVLEVEITIYQYMELKKQVEYYLKNRNKYKYNFLGPILMLIFGTGVKSRNRYFCSEWIVILLKNIGIDLFPSKKPHHIRPFDFYEKLYENIIYEGKSSEYVYRKIDGKYNETEICIL